MFRNMSLANQFVLAAAGIVVAGGLLAGAATGSALVGLGTALCGVFGAAVGGASCAALCAFLVRGQRGSAALGFTLIGGFVGLSIGAFFGGAAGYNALKPDESGAVEPPEAAHIISLEQEPKKHVALPVLKLS